MRASHARQNEAETGSNGRHEVEKQAREQLRPEASICQQCTEAFVFLRKKFKAPCMVGSFGRYALREAGPGHAAMLRSTLGAK